MASSILNTLKGSVMNHIQIIRSAVSVAHDINELPSIPTQHWVEQCAIALCRIDPSAAAVSLVCNYRHESDHLSVFSSGAHVALGTQDQAQSSRASLALQDRAERMTKLEIQLPPHTCTVGLVSPLASLSNEPGHTPIARVVGTANLRHTILSFVPIRNTENGTLMLLNIVGFAQDQHAQRPDNALHLLHALHMPLRLRATAALENVNNPRAWLTDREQSVLELLIQGNSVRAIAEQLGRSAHTIHDHVKNLHKKIGASSRGELIAKAIGHTPEEHRQHIPEPILNTFPGDQPIAEMKPKPLSARPLRATAEH